MNFAVDIDHKVTVEMGSIDESTSSRNGLAFSKLTLMLILLLIDLGCNCSIDYDSYNNTHNKNVIRGMFFMNVVVEISIFLILFLSMAETYLFRVGLVGILLKQFRLVLFVQFLYLILTIVTGIYRYKILVTEENNVVELWKTSTFVGLSLTQKTGTN